MEVSTDATRRSIMLIFEVMLLCWWRILSLAMRDCWLCQSCWLSSCWKHFTCPCNSAIRDLSSSLCFRSSSLAAASAARRFESSSHSCSRSSRSCLRTWLSPLISSCSLCRSSSRVLMNIIFSSERSRRPSSSSSSTCCACCSHFEWFVRRNQETRTRRAVSASRCSTTSLLIRFRIPLRRSSASEKLSARLVSSSHSLLSFSTSWASLSLSFLVSCSSPFTMFSSMESSFCRTALLARLFAKVSFLFNSSCALFSAASNLACNSNTFFSRSVLWLVWSFLILSLSRLRLSTFRIHASAARRMSGTEARMVL
mmetsp:Transcript_36356/g.81976  ORF Transcript_36356/g.81976 Transcript_36356/m.81976 type:complete len:312 (-) Transcript_36356:934-1869(-)